MRVGRPFSLGAAPITAPGSPILRSLMVGLVVWCGTGCEEPVHDEPAIPTAPGPGALEERIRTELDGLDARTALYAKHLPTGREVAVRADEPMNTLSVIKIAALVQAYRDSEAGRLDLERRHEIRPEDLRRGSGLLQTFDLGLEPTVRDLVTQMIVTSDNTATDIVAEILDLDRVNAMLREEGFQETRFRMTTGDLFREVWIRADPGHAELTHQEVYRLGFPVDGDQAERSFALEGDSTRWLGRSTARETGRLLESIHNGLLASRESSDEMLGILQRQFYSSRLPRYLAGRASVAHKTGDWPPIAGSDVGILMYEGGPTVVAVYTGQNRGDFLELERALGRIALDLVESWR